MFYFYDKTSCAWPRKLSDPREQTKMKQRIIFLLVASGYVFSAILTSSGIEILIKVSHTIKASIRNRNVIRSKDTSKA